MPEVALELRACITFFTKVPLPATEPPHGADYMAHAPLIGAAIGALKSLAILGFTLIFSTEIAVVLGIIFALVLTGALHEDGFMDTCDGFGLAHSRERTIDIMRDPRAGAFAVIGIVVLLGLRALLLEHLLRVCETQVFIALLAAAHGLSRLAAIWPLATDDYVGGTGKSSAVAHRLSGKAKRLAWCWATLAVAPALWFNPAAALIAVLAVALCYDASRRLFLRRLGGYTGDCLGALQQTTQAVAYLACAAVMPLAA
ncbi:MAG: adenosylcobinamide-GDP ribazoletransferase [Gammaproteobacteria bacterium]|nr:adenosylcobinamide-GDP ribazoletransferase [Gammaproteobacteria bacterium]